MKKILSLILVFVMLFSINIYADDTKSNITKLEGIILEENGALKFATSKNVYIIESENQDMLRFLAIIANEGVKVFGEGIITDNKINLTYTETTTQLSKELQTEYETMLMNTTGLDVTYQDVLIKKAENFYVILNEKEYILETEDEYLRDAIALLANTDTKVQLSGLLFTNKLKAYHLAPMKRLSGELLEEFTNIYNRALAEKQKYGVIISEGADSYLLVESNTNKMYYLKTNDAEVRGIVPIIANCGQKVIITCEELSNGMLNVLVLDFDGEIEEVIKDKVTEYKKKTVENTKVYEIGKIKKEKEDYNFYYTNIDTGKEEQYGLIAKNTDVVAAIQVLADKDLELKILGYINYEKTLFDVRNISINEELSEEELKKINEEIDKKKKENISQGASKDSSSNQQTSTNTQKNDTTTNNNSNNTTTNNNNSNNTTSTQNPTTNNSNNFSSLFANLNTSDLFANFGNLTNGNSLFSNLNTGDLFSNFGNLTNGNSLLNNLNTSDLFANFGNLTGGNNSLLGNLNTSNLGSLFSNLNTSDLFANFGLTSMFSGTTQNQTQDQTQNNDTSVFSEINN